MTKPTDDRRLAALAAQAAQGRVSRRHFMEGALALGVTVSAASALWSNEVRAATPKKGGTYRVGLDDGKERPQLWWLKGQR